MSDPYKGQVSRLWFILVHFIFLYSIVLRTKQPAKELKELELELMKGIGIGIDIFFRKGIGIGIGIDNFFRKGIGIGIGIEFQFQKGIGIGIGIDQKEFVPYLPTSMAALTL